MKIAIDCRMINSSGVGIYLQGVLPYLLKSHNDFLLLGNTSDLQLFKSYTNVNILQCNIKPFSIKDLFYFPPSLLKHINSCSLFFSPFFNIPASIFKHISIPVYTCIHDLAFHDIPGLTSVIGLALRKLLYRRSYQKSKKIFTVSNFSKSRIEYHFGTSKPVVVTYSALQPFIISYIEQKQKPQKTKTIVFVGNIKKHKGLGILCDAFIKAKNNGLQYKLIIIGEKKNFRSSDNSIMEKINNIKNEDIYFTGNVSNATLLHYLSQAALLVQPSLYEGFGLPPLEAMALGTCVLVSDIPVFREIYDGFPLHYFKSQDTNDLANKLMELLFEKTPPSPLLSKELLSQYTFKKTSSIILQELM